MILMIKAYLRDLALAGLCSLGLHSAMGEISIAVKPESPTYGVGAAILLDFSIQNSGSGVLTFAKEPKAHWIFSVREDKGGNLLKAANRMTDDGFESEAVHLKSKAILTETIFLNEWYTFRNPGKYRVVAQLVNGRKEPLATASFDIEINDSGKAGSGQSIEGKLARLQELMDSKEASPEMDKLFVEVVFSGEPAVVPFLNKIARNDQISMENRSSAIAGLSRVGNKPAAEGLVDLSRKELKMNSPLRDELLTALIDMNLTASDPAVTALVSPVIAGMKEEKGEMTKGERRLPVRE